MWFNRVLMMVLPGLAFACLASGTAGASPATAADAGAGRLAQLIQQELGKRYPGARIELSGSFYWQRGSMPQSIQSVSLMNESTRGQAHIQVNGANGSQPMLSEGWVAYSAWMPALIAQKRVTPGTRLSRDLFAVQEINVATGMAYEYRGVLLPKDTDVSGLEARQSILEGQYALTSGVQKVPDVKRGDPVRIRMMSGGVHLLTTGQAEEPAYMGGLVRVITNKSKRTLVGKLNADGVVEVKL